MRPETIAALWREIEPLIGPPEPNAQGSTCRRWQGAYTRYADRRPKAPSILIGGSFYNPQRVMLERDGVELPRYARLHVACGNPLCMERAHVGLRASGTPAPSKQSSKARRAAVAPPDPAALRPGDPIASAVAAAEAAVAAGRTVLIPFPSGSCVAFTREGYYEGTPLSVCAQVERERHERAARDKAGAR